MRDLVRPPAEVKQMPSYEATIVIDAPVEHVWSVPAEVSQWPLWLPTVTSVEPLGIAFHGPLGWLAGFIAGGLTREYIEREAAA